MKLVLASNNKKKLLELAAIMPPQFTLSKASDFDLISPEETGTTFVENAIIKARHACLMTGLPAIADDSGLEVDHLSGAPGIYSSRYAGESASDADNNTKLLEALQGLPLEERKARFRCIIVFMRHHLDPMPLIAAGTWQGSILEAPSGEQGFGYDPLFYVPSHDCSSAQLLPEIKNTISHRAQALRVIAPLLADIRP